jgi:predicted heme/steroid binding protein
VANAPAVPAAPPIPSNAQGCVGAIVSSATHSWQQTTHQGLGGAAKDLGVNVGKSIQEAATGFCGKH